jgi:hypothetical protein
MLARAIRAVRAWLAPWITLQRWWAAWSNAPPPPPLQALISSLAAGYGLHSTSRINKPPLGDEASRLAIRNSARDTNAVMSDQERSRNLISLRAIR